MILFKFFLYFYVLSFLAKVETTIKYEEKKDEKKKASKIKKDKNVLKLQEKVLKKEKQNDDFSKKKPPKDYFSEILNPLNSNELDSKISEAIEYGAQALLIINWRDDSSDDKFIIGKFLQNFMESDDLFNSYGILVASLQTKVSSLQEVVKILGFGDTNGVAQAAKDQTASYHPGIIMVLLPKEPIPNGTTYFVENSTLQFSTAKLIMNNSDIMTGSKKNYSSTGSSKKDPSVLTSINLSSDLPGKIKTSIQNYLNESSLKSLKDQTFYGKTKNKIFQDKTYIKDKLKNKTN